MTSALQPSRDAGETHDINSCRTGEKAKRKARPCPMGSMMSLPVGPERSEVEASCGRSSPKPSWSV
jgi:hypothetical protein